MNEVPAWIQVLQALLTPAIALGVGIIAFLQWRTAHQKVLLDLFERRLKIYDAVISAVDQFSNSGPVDVSLQARMKLQIATSEARFLFGDEVLAHLQTLIEDMSKVIMKVRRIDSQSVAWSARDKLIEEVAEIGGRIDTWSVKFSKLCYPYIRMDQKRVRTPGEWLADRNSRRLSYADEKQK